MNNRLVSLLVLLVGIFAGVATITGQLQPKLGGVVAIVSALVNNLVRPVTEAQPIQS